MSRGDPQTPEPRPAGIRASSAYLPELDSLRGIAILLVMFFHSDGLVRMPFSNSRGMWPSPLRAFVLGGHTGVSLFFILSALLLSVPFLAEADGGRVVSRTSFYRRRALRILPLYWTAVIVFMVLAADRPRDVLRALPYLAFLNSVPTVGVPIHPYTDVLWSLATEVQFYVLLPLLPLCLGSPQRRRWGLALLLAYGAAYAVFLAGLTQWVPPSVGFFLPLSVFGRGPFFLFGILAAWIYRRHGDRIREWRGWRAGVADLALIACVLGLGCMLQRIVFFGYETWEVPPYFAWHILEGALWTAIVLLTLLAPLRLRPLLVNPVLARMGLLSYSIYLLHAPVLHFSLHFVRTTFMILTLDWIPPLLLWLVGGTALTIALSTLTYRFIERPFLVRKARIEV